MNEIIVIDFGSQYSQLICRRVREAHVYAELIPWDQAEKHLRRRQPAGIILSGGPDSVYDQNAPTLAANILDSAVPVLGICYGLQLLVHTLGGGVAGSTAHEYGAVVIEIDKQAPLFNGLSQKQQVWMSHADHVTEIPTGFESIATSTNAPFAAIANQARKIYGLQFHPEVTHTPHGALLIENFVRQICGCTPDWTSDNFIQKALTEIRTQVGESGHVVCGLSGGVDSAVTAALLHRAIGDRLACIFVDHGLLRLHEAQEVIQTFQGQQGMSLTAVDAKEDFLADLDGVIDPEEKRRRIGNRFIRIFEQEATRLAHQWQTDTPAFLAQGTLYPDVIESASEDQTRHARTIKTHHNVGGLPDDMRFELVEPLRTLFKDEVRAVGALLGLPEEIIWRHPFPGPGLAVRILGAVTWERLEMLRQADAIFLHELRRADLYRATSQTFAVLLPTRSVGVMGDGRSYADTIALRAVTTDDFMTADWARLPYDLLEKVSNRIVNEVSGINRVVYDISSKPPATIEWE